MIFFRSILSRTVLAALLTLPVGAMGQEDGEDAFVTLMTMGEVQGLLDLIGFEVLDSLSLDEMAAIDFVDDSYLLIAADFIDFNVIGAGRQAVLHPGQIRQAVVVGLKEGLPADAIGADLIELVKGWSRQQQFAARPATGQRQIKTRFGAFMVNEFELHQEPDGEYLQLLEINQVRIYFSAQTQEPDGENEILFLAEWNPVPEEVIHHIDEITIRRGGRAGTLAPVDNEIEGLVPFEQLFVKVQNAGGAGVNLTFGQFRNPFGLWSDYTSHRNFSTTKNNVLVNGFALKKIELGVMAERALAGPLSLQAAVVHGRPARTAPLDRADTDNTKDLVAHLTYRRPAATVGASVYLEGFRLDENIALGLDWTLPLPRLTLSGEAVYQKNSDVNGTFGTAFDFDEVSALSGYAQFDYLVNSKMHFYGFYEAWRYSAGGTRVNDPAYKVFHGLRYYLNQNLRWTVAEYGRMFHNDFDEGHTHLSTQLEFSF